MISWSLVSLSECVMILKTILSISETSKISFRSRSFLYFHSYYLDLIISKSYLDFKNIWHYKLLSLNGVEEMFSSPCIWNDMLLIINLVLIGRLLYKVCLIIQLFLLSINGVSSFRYNRTVIVVLNATWTLLLSLWLRLRLF